MKRIIILGLLVLAFLGIVAVVNAQIVPSLMSGKRVSLDAEETRDWRSNGIEPVAAASQPDISREKAVGIAKGFAQGLDKATEVNAHYVKLDKGTVFDGDHWIITFKGVQIPAAGGHPDGVNDDRQMYFDTYNVVIDSKSGKAILGFSGPGKQLD